jgi:hypothetical protein
MPVGKAAAKTKAKAKAKDATPHKEAHQPAADAVDAKPVAAATARTVVVDDAGSTGAPANAEVISTGIDHATHHDAPPERTEGAAAETTAAAATHGKPHAVLHAKRETVHAGVQAICVASRAATGRHRAGRFFTRDEVTIPLADLTDDQLKAIRADPYLVVTETVIHAPKES